jgi:hypothetical protein
MAEGLANTQIPIPLKLVMIIAVFLPMSAMNLNCRKEPLSRKELAKTKSMAVAFCLTQRTNWLFSLL